MAEPMATRYQRSWVFVPGDRPEQFAKAAASSAHAVVCELRITNYGFQALRIAQPQFSKGPRRFRDRRNLPSK